MRRQVHLVHCHGFESLKNTRQKIGDAIYNFTDAVWRFKSYLHTSSITKGMSKASIFDIQVEQQIKELILSQKKIMLCKKNWAIRKKLEKTFQKYSFSTITHKVLLIETILKSFCAEMVMVLNFFVGNFLVSRKLNWKKAFHWSWYLDIHVKFQRPSKGKRAVDMI